MNKNIKAQKGLAVGKTFTFTSPDAIEISHIIQRNQGDAAFLHKLLARALNVEAICTAYPTPQAVCREATHA